MAGRHDFSSFRSRSCSVAKEQVSAQIDHGLRGDVDGGQLRFSIGSVLATIDYRILDLAYLE